MSVAYLQEVALLIKDEQHSILEEWLKEIRKLPKARHMDTASVLDHIGDLLIEMAHELENCLDETTVEGLKYEPVTHGLHRLAENFEIEEVVADYNALRNVLQKFIEARGLHLRGSVNYTINRIIDKSIGLSLKTYTHQQALETQERRREHLTFITHDLRSPLAAMSLTIHRFEKTLADKKDEPTVKFLYQIRRQIDQFNGLIAKILHEELAGNNNLQLNVQEIHLKELAAKTIDDMAPLAEESDTRLTNNVPDDISICANENMATLMLQNLLSNAIKYTAKGDIFIGAQKSGPDFVECWVKDTGTGIPPSRVGKIFDKLETDPERKGGLGLGLAIVKRFVEVHRGKVWVESKLGEGSTFHFTLPARKWKM